MEEKKQTFLHYIVHNQLKQGVNFGTYRHLFER